MFKSTDWDRIEKLARHSPVTIRQRDPRYRPSVTGNLVTAAAIAVSFGLAAAAGWSIYFSGPSPLSVGVVACSLVLFVAIIWRTIEGDLSRWSVEVHIEEQRKKVLTQVQVVHEDGRSISYGDFVDNATLVQLARAVVEKGMRSISGRSLHQHGVVSDRNKRDEVEKVQSMFSAFGWVANGEINTNGFRGLREVLVSSTSPTPPRQG